MYLNESSTERDEAALYQADKLVTKLLRCFNTVTCYVGYKYVRISGSNEGYEDTARYVVAVCVTKQIIHKR